MEGVCVMAKWGKCDFRQLEAMQKKLENMEKESDEFCRKCAQELALRLLALVKDRTLGGKAPKIKGPKSVKVKVKNADGKIQTRSFLSADAARIQQYWSGYTGGTLRRGWTASIPSKGSGGWEIEIINNVFYASYVEYGHRQTPGRYVPALGKKLKKGWVEGKFMLTKSAKDLERAAPGILERKLQKFLKECLDAE